jgi:uncharacterized protein (TIGR02453 family)
MANSAHFSSAFFKFFKELEHNNNRDWFQRNKQRYETDVKEPILRFIVDFGPRLEQISQHFLADPRPVGGSMFRIYRDTRFSKDKRPYKTNAGIQFRHEAGRDVHAPGFYLHLSPTEVFAGSGIWHPDGKTLAQIRQAIVENPDGWRKATRKRGMRLGGDSLKRPPRGFDPDHPLIEDLKRKDFVTLPGADQPVRSGLPIGLAFRGLPVQGGGSAVLAHGGLTCEGLFGHGDLEA